ncbi:bifunctional tetrahydrofolate synthase/dihydrofolate synthase, partial [Salmonella enterica subsp. enterica]
IKAGIFRAGKPAMIGQASAPASLLAYAQKIGAVTHQRDANWQLDVEENKWSFSDSSGELTDLASPKMPLENVATAIAALRASGLS